MVVNCLSQPHCYPLIQRSDVISLEHLKQMKSSEFIELISFAS
jgi:hypothetical protein